MCKVRLLNADEIEVKVKQVCKSGAFALLYKTARTDMALLDETFGEENWKNDYKEIKGNLFCGIAVWNGTDWVWRWDCGIESREDDGNEKKGEASDSFKRAGTRWGIGRELYTSPKIFLKVPVIESNGKYYLENKFASFEVKDIGYDENRRISSLRIVDNNNNIVFSYPNSSKSSKKTANTEVKRMPLEEAQNTEFEMGGKVYKVGNLSIEWLERNIDKTQNDDLKTAMQIVLKFKKLEAMEAKENE